MRGQIWSFDFSISLIIFTTVLVIVLFFWSYASYQSFEQLQLEALQDSAISVSDTLIKSRGVPDNWTSGNVIIIGLAESEKIISEERLYQFVQMTYPTAKSIMGLGRYEYYFELVYSNSSLATAGGLNATAGEYPSESSIIAPVERYVLYNGEISKARMLIWLSR